MSGRSGFGSQVRALGQRLDKMHPGQDPQDQRSHRQQQHDGDAGQSNQTRIAQSIGHSQPLFQLQIFARR